MIRNRPPKTAADLFGVQVKPRNARDRLLTTAIDLFYSRGLNAVGLDQILKETGVTKTTFYKHFESKDQLIVEAIRRRDRWEMKAWQRAVRKAGGRSPRAQLLAIFDVLDLWFNDPDFHGCLFINAAAEFPNPYDPVHQVASDHKKRNRDLYRDLASKAGASDPEALADQYTLLVEGTLILRHVHHRNDAARIARPLASSLLDAALPT
jgi:AcrR family transcriptional regulator